MGSGGFASLLGRNANYRRLWLAQLVSEVGDHFNSVAVLSLTLHLTGSNSSVGLVMVARTLPMVLAGPFAGVWLDRFDRRQVMLWSDLLRGGVALAFLVLLEQPSLWLLYLLSGLLTFGSPFFTAGRSSILPAITNKEELHTANALTQTTAWLTLSLGTFLGGWSTMAFGFGAAIVLNALSFFFSAWMVWRLRPAEGESFRPPANPAKRPNGWQEFRAGIGLLVRTPLLLAIALAGVGWASGGGAAQILFSLFGEVVFRAGAFGVGVIWGAAGVGLVVGGVVGHRYGQKMSFAQYKWAIATCFLVLGTSYMAFSQMPTMAGAVVCILVSRVAMGMNNVLNRSMLLHQVPNAYRGRIFTTVELLMSVTMAASMGVASLALAVYSIRTVALLAGAVTTLTAVFWAGANWAGYLRAPELEEREEEPG